MKIWSDEEISSNRWFILVYLMVHAYFYLKNVGRKFVQMKKCHRTLTEGLFGCTQPESRLYT